MRTVSTKENALFLQHIPTCGCLVWSCTQIQHSILVKNLRSPGNRFLNRDLVRRLRLPRDGTPASSDGAFVRLVIVSSTSTLLSQSTGRVVSLTPCVQLSSQVMTTGRVNCNRWRAEIFKMCMFSAQLCKESQNPGKLQKRFQTICLICLILCNLHPKQKHRGKETELRC